ncbi:DsrE family protein [Candidatus Poribacteria bacterium]|nr:DsrE family protein [Candidatus Poribacteria bacterium]
MSKLMISITHGKDNTDKATVGFVVANASAASGVETVVFLSTEGVHLSQNGYADHIQEEGFAPLKQLMADFAEVGGTIWVCSPCFKKRNLDEDNLVDSALIVGGAKAVEFLITGGSSITY